MTAGNGSSGFDTRQGNEPEFPPFFPQIVLGKAMRNSSALILVGKTSDPDDLLGLAANAREHSFHLSLLVLGMMPPVPVYSYGIGQYGSPEVPAQWHEQFQSDVHELSEAAKAYSRMLAGAGVEADTRVLCSELRAMREEIARRALTADFVVPVPSLRDDEQIFSEALRGVLFHSPSPIVLNAPADAPWLEPRRVFIAWNGGIQASRAVRAALPLLRDAAEVTLAIFDPVMTEYEDGENPGSDVARWLTHRGCKVTVQQYPGGGVEIGTGILKRAAECEAELIVMGAYGHSRIRETVFGGTTQILVEQTEQQVLLAH